jgi:hypothetical protein
LALYSAPVGESIGQAAEMLYPWIGQYFAFLATYGQPMGGGNAAIDLRMERLANFSEPRSSRRKKAQVFSEINWSFLMTLLWAAGSVRVENIDGCLCANYTRSTGSKNPCKKCLIFNKHRVVHK